jgi:hypothetical protein
MSADELQMELIMVHVHGGNIYTHIVTCRMHIRASTIPFQNALEMELMLAAGQLGGKERTKKWLNMLSICKVLQLTKWQLTAEGSLSQNASRQMLHASSHAS